mgnify:CR=1 FL=1
MDEYHERENYNSNFQIVRSDNITQIQADVLVMDYDHDYVRNLLFSICDNCTIEIRKLMITVKSLALGYKSLPCNTRLYPELNSNCFTTTSFNDAYRYFVFSFISHNINVNTTIDIWLGIYNRYISNMIDGMLNHIYNNLKCSSVAFVSSGVTETEISRLRMWVINNAFVRLLKKKYRELKCIWIVPENNECFSQAPLLDIVKTEIEKKRISKYEQLQKEEKIKFRRI